MHTIRHIGIGVALIGWLITTLALVFYATPAVAQDLAIREAADGEVSVYNAPDKDEAVEGETVEGETLEGEAAEGELSEGEEVFSREIVMPRLEHRTLEEAHALLESNSLTLGRVTHECNNMLAAGVVIRQNPAFGDHVPVNTEVNLVVSSGRCLLGCDSYTLNDWGKVFLGALAALVLLTLGLFVGEEEFVNPFNFM